MKKRRFSNLQIIALGFALIAFAGTVLLMLPVSSKTGEWTPFLTSFFTSVSASCVTGLVLVDTATHWSLFGQIIILVLIQLGGLGFMSIATFFLSFTKKNIDLRKRNIMAESINTAHISGMKQISRKILIGTAVFEGIGAVLLSVRFIGEFGFVKGIYYGIFHSVSAFCNAGFDLMGENEAFCSLVDYSDDFLINITLCALITIGGIGFLVWEDIIKNKYHLKKYQLHSKLVLATSAILTIGGALLFFIFENNNSLAEMGAAEKILSSIFSSVTCRTAGFNTVDFSSLGKATTLLMCFLMFVGGSSGSTAGGVKTTTVSVIFLNLISSLRGHKNPVIFGRRFEDDTLKKAVTVCVFNLSLIFIAVTTICAMQDFELSDVLFEIFSAMSTVGMSTGITRELNTISKLIVIFLMYAGRVGSISFALAILEKRAQPPILYPAEAITVG